MKRSTITLFLSTVTAICAMGQTMDSASGIALYGTGTTTITNVGAENTGVLQSVGCQLTESTAGSISAVLKVYLAGGSSYTSYTLFSSSASWANSLLPYRTITTPSNMIETSNGDVFVLPLNVPYTNGLLVELVVTSAGTAGVIACSDLRT